MTLTDNGTFIPNNSLTQFEMSRLEFDNYGALKEMNLDRQNMMIAFFLFTKVLIAKIMLQPETYSGMKMQATPNVKKNLKLIASVIHSLTKNYFMGKVQAVTH